MDLITESLEVHRHYYNYYRDLGTKAMAQLNTEELLAKPFEGDANIAITVQHISGNLKSRFTDFLTADGEKAWRDRDQEFEDVLQTKEAIVACWHEGWAVVDAVLDGLTAEHMGHGVSIRNEPYSVQKALIRSLNHTAYHVGQIVFLAKSLKGAKWQSLSIPKGGSKAYNAKIMGGA